MNKLYKDYALSRLDGQFGVMSSWRFVYPYIKNKKVLDVGCSDGLYLQYMTKDSQGIEQLPSLAEAAERKGLRIINGELSQLICQVENETYEGVLFSHVMEHVESPIVILQEICRVLKPKGTLVLGLPIERNIYRDLFRMDYFNGTHIYAFSVRNTHKLLAETGFRPVRVFFHLPKCASPVGRVLENCWNLIRWPFREYLSMAYWVIASKQS